MLNGIELDPAEVSDGIRIQLPDLAADNELLVVADAPYMNTGEGLHRFVDPVDNEVYLYTQFEVPDSRRMFAVFEQPDLKASFTFTVTAPSHWDVISNSPTPVPVETTPGEDGGARSVWEFRPHSAAVLVRHGTDRRTVPVRAQRGDSAPTDGSSRWGCSPASRSCSTSTRTTSSNSPARDSSSSKHSSAARTRSRSTTSCSSRSSMPAPWRTPAP